MAEKSEEEVRKEFAPQKDDNKALGRLMDNLDLPEEERGEVSIEDMHGAVRALLNGHDDQGNPTAKMQKFTQDREDEQSDKH